ncbi:MAG TPA: cytochrome c-type biogenesis protein CcmH [Thermoanaerobaculia bacterium]|nr:cytochrome c-type biogenesis protein CcmH [Thermoanaerobaculia bacterium]
MKRAFLLMLALLSIAAALPAQEPGPMQAAPATEIRTPSPETIVGPPKGTPLAGAELEAKTKDVASVIRCPTCQGLSVFDSPAAMAINMKHQTRDLLAQGYTQDQILDYFEASYGEFVRLNPGTRGMNWLVWALPLLLLAAGIWAIVGFLRKSGRRAPAADSAPVNDVEEAIDPALLPYVLRVRELAYGWPGGVRPEEP